MSSYILNKYWKKEEKSEKNILYYNNNNNNKIVRKIFVCNKNKSFNPMLYTAIFKFN